MGHVLLNPCTLATISRIRTKNYDKHMEVSDLLNEKNFSQVHKKFFEYLKPSNTGDFSRIPTQIVHSYNCFSTKFKGDHDYRVLIYDAFNSCIYENIPPEKVSSLIPQFFGNINGLIPYCSSLLASLDILTQNSEGKQRSNFLRLVSNIARFLDDSSIKEFIDPETLEKSGVIKNCKLFNQKIVRLKTKLFYKQKKFNLLREESEGYSKLIVGFQSLPTMAETDEGIQLFISRIISLIGCFSLDPYRTFDLIVEYLSFSKCNRSDLLIEHYIRQSGIICMKEIFNFKLFHNQVPIKLWDYVASAIRRKELELLYVYQLLTPSDEELLQKVKDLEKKEEDLLKRVTSYTLQESTKIIKQQNKTCHFMDCHKVLLLAAFLNAVDLEGIDFYFTRFPIDLLKAYPCVVKSLLHAIGIILEPFYSKLNFRLVQKVDNADFDYKEIYKTPLLNLIYAVGYNVCEDTLVFTKLIRTFLYIFKYCSPDEKFRSISYLIICKCFFPGLTQSECNCVLSEELWLLIRLFPYTIRYKFYSYMEMHAYSIYGQLSRTKIIITKNIKFICKRITKDTVKHCGRQLGKLSHTNPVILLSEIMNQICSFETMIIPIVECLKYLTPLSFDILSFEIIQFLSANSVSLTSKITSIPDIIQNIGTFAAMVIRKYSVPTTGILQYIANQLKDSNPLDLIVLREILQKMSGIEEAHLNDQQICFLSGSEALQEEAGVRLSSKSPRKYAIRLRDSLMEANLTLPFYFMMSQQKQRLIYDPQLNEIHLKLIGNLYDQCHKTLVQYGRFIAKYIPKNHIIGLTSSFSNLKNDYGISLDCIFFLVRHIFHNDIFNIPKNLLYIQTSNNLLEVYLVLLDEILPPKVEIRSLSKLICIFWLLDLYDIVLPKQKYDEFLIKSQQTLAALDESKDSTTKRNKERERQNNLIKLLTQDRDQQRIHVAYIKQWLFEVMSDANIKNTKNEFSNIFYQICIYPRSIFSSCDAIFSAEFIFTLHDIRCHNFNSLSLLDKIFSENVHVIASLSEAEANSFGMFLNKVWQNLLTWHSSKNDFEQNCSKHPGFSIFSKAEQEKSDGYEFNNFRHLMYKWQYKQTKSFIFALESKNYVQIRNTIIILTKINSCFPKVINHKIAIEKRIEKLVEEEKDQRPDIYVLVTCYSGILKNLKDIVEESEFHHKETNNERPKNSESDGHRTNITHISSLSLKLDDGSKSGGFINQETDDHIKRKDAEIFPDEANKSSDNQQKRNNLQTTTVSVDDISISGSTDPTVTMHSERKRVSGSKEENRTKRKKENDSDRHFPIDKISTSNNFIQTRATKASSVTENPQSEIIDNSNYHKNKPDNYLSRPETRQYQEINVTKRDLKKRRL